MEKANRTPARAAKRMQDELDKAASRFMRQHKKAYEVLSKY